MLLKKKKHASVPYFYPIARVPVFLRIQHEQLGKELLPVHHTCPTRTSETAMMRRNGAVSRLKKGGLFEGLYQVTKEVGRVIPGTPHSHTTPNPESLKMWE